MLVVGMLVCVMLAMLMVFMLGMLSILAMAVSMGPFLVWPFKSWRELV